MKTISVVTTTWDNLYVSRLCVEYFRKNAGIDHKFVVVDNGSTDGSKEYYHDLVLHGVIDTLISNPLNYGAARGRNQGILAFDTDYTCLIDSDHIIGPDWLKFLYDTYESDLSSKIGILSSGGIDWRTETREPYISTGVKLRDLNNRYIHAPQRTVEVCKNTLSGIYGNFDDFSRKFTTDFYNTIVEFGGISACLVRREVFDTIGLFDEIYNLCMVEDFDWWNRVFEGGWTGKSIYRAFCHHFAGTTTSRFDSAGVQEQHYRMRSEKVAKGNREVLSPENLSIAKRYRRYQ